MKPACSIDDNYIISPATADFTESNATDAGSEPICCFTIETPALSAQIWSWSIAAPWRYQLHRAILFPGLPVLICQFGDRGCFPWAIYAYDHYYMGCISKGGWKIKVSTVRLSSRRDTISSFSIVFSSLVLRYLSLATLALSFDYPESSFNPDIGRNQDLFKIIKNLIVNFDLPTTAWTTYKDALLVFWSPLSSFSLFSLVKNPSKAIIISDEWLNIKKAFFSHEESLKYLPVSKLLISWWRVRIWSLWTISSWNW